MAKMIDKRCEECLKHLSGDCEGEKDIDGLACWQSAEEVAPWSETWEHWRDEY